MPLLYCLNPPSSLADELHAVAAFEPGACETRHFADGESYVRATSDCRGRDTVILCSLTPPDAWILPLIFLAGTLHELGARSVGLIAPYLPYMRQDRRFREGEAVSARLFAKVLTASIDWLVTVDPHLHRFHSLDELYDVPCRVVPAAPMLSAWIGRHVERPLLVGPDAESEQWVSAVAQGADAPFVVLDKVRSGDREVAVTGPSLERWAGRTPVLLDDMITTGHTLLQAAALLRKASLDTPVCVAVHGLFVEQALQRLREAGIRQVVTTNTVPHATNAIDVGSAIATAVASLRDETNRYRDRNDT